jgi:uncharacterized protein
MPATNAEIVFTPAAQREQIARGSAKGYAKKLAAGFPDRVTPNLAGFLAELDTAFLGTASADGAPYIQHRGGPKGFIKVLDDKTLGFADFAGNRQYITLGNLSENPKAFIYLMDYVHSRRIKLWGTAKVVENDEQLLEQLRDSDYKRGNPERAIVFTLAAWDMNCQQHIHKRLPLA